MASVFGLMISDRLTYEQTDPSEEAIVEIVQALKGIEPAAAKKFVELYY